MLIKASWNEHQQKKWSCFHYILAIISTSSYEAISGPQNARVTSIGDKKKRTMAQGKTHATDMAFMSWNKWYWRDVIRHSYVWGINMYANNHHSYADNELYDLASLLAVASQWSVPVT